MQSRHRMQTKWDVVGARIERLRCVRCDNVEMLVTQEPVMKRKGHQVRVVARCRMCGEWARLTPGPVK